MKHYPPLESSDIEGMWNGLGDGGDLDQIITQDQVMEMGIATLAGAGGIMLAGTTLPRIPWVNEEPWRKAVAAILFGMLGGRLLWDVNREAALGMAGGMSGAGLASLVGQWTGVDVSLSDLGEISLAETTVITSQAEELLGNLPEETQFPGSTDILAIGDGYEASPTVTQQNLAPVELQFFDETTQIETERERLLGSWLGG
jgi:hypothetical protein